MAARTWSWLWLFGCVCCVRAPSGPPELDLSDPTAARCSSGDVESCRALCASDGQAGRPEREARRRIPGCRRACEAVLGAGGEPNASCVFWRRLTEQEVGAPGLAEVDRAVATQVRGARDSRLRTCELGHGPACVEEVRKAREKSPDDLDEARGVRLLEKGCAQGSAVGCLLLAANHVQRGRLEQARAAAESARASAEAKERADDAEAGRASWMLASALAWCLDPGRSAVERQQRCLEAQSALGGRYAWGLWGRIDLLGLVPASPAP